jgi:hypothetical protein
MRFLSRHLTSILVVMAIASWAIFYLPTTPSWSVYELKNAIDARNGDAAAVYVDFDSVVTHAAAAMVNQRSSGNPIAGLIGSAALSILEKPLSNLVRNQAIAKVNGGEKDVQMPAAAVALSIVMLRHSGDVASTRFTDHKGQEWEIRLKRDNDGLWRVSEVGNIEQVIERLREHESKQLNPN